MSRNRSRESESQDLVPRRFRRGEVSRLLLADWRAGFDPVPPGSIDWRRHGRPGTIDIDALTQQVLAAMHDGYHLSMEGPGQPLDGLLEFATAVRDEGFGFRTGTVQTVPRDGYPDLDLTVEFDTTFVGRRAATLRVEVDGSPRALPFPATFDVLDSGVHIPSIKPGHILEGQTVALSLDVDGAPTCSKVRATMQLVDSAASEMVPTVQGTVTDGDGPVEGAEVTVDGQSETTDDSGWFRMEVSEGTHTVTVEQDGYVTHSEQVTVGKEWITVDVTLAPVTISGTVTEDGTTDPISGATVTLNGHNDTTDAQGGYSLPGVLDGSYTLTVTHPDYDDHNEPITVARESKTVDVGMVSTPDAPTSLLGRSYRDTSLSTASVSASPHPNTVAGDIVIISVVAASTSSGSYGTFSPASQPTQLHRFSFVGGIGGGGNGVEAAVYWWRSNGTIPSWTYQLSGSASQTITVMVATYREVHFPSGNPFSTVNVASGTSGTGTRSTRSASNPGGAWTLGVGMAVRNTTTTGSGTDYEQLWGSMAHNIVSAERGSTSGTAINTPDWGAPRAGYQTHGAVSAGVSVTFGQEYTHQYAVAVAVG